MTERERERDRERERKREKIGIFSMMGFDSATSSFLDLLVHKSYKKTEKGKIKKFSTSR